LKSKCRKYLYLRDINLWYRKMEIPIRNRILYSLLFADNQVIFAQDEDDMRSMIKKLIEEYEK